MSELSSMPKIALACGMLACALAVSSCSASSGQECEQDSDCAPGYECVSTGGVVFGEHLCLVSAAGATDAGSDTAESDADADGSRDTSPDADATADVTDALDATDTADTADTRDTSDTGDTADAPDADTADAGGPVLNDVTLVSESGGNTVNDNLFLTIDASASVVGVITDWQINGESLTQLVLPLDRADGTGSPVYGGSQATCELDGGTATPTIEPGKIAGAYGFDGDDRVLCTGTFVYHEPFSAEVWFKPDRAQEGSGNAGLVSAVDDNRADWSWQLRYGSPDQGRLGWKMSGEGGNAWLSIDRDLTDDQWYHLVATYEGTTARLYLDGTEVDMAAVALVAPLGVDLQIGSDGWSNNFDGSIDGVRLYRRALSAAQVAALHRAGSGDEGEPTDGHTLVAAETAASDTIQACATPHDGEVDGPEVCSNSVTVYVAE